MTTLSPLCAHAGRPCRFMDLNAVCFIALVSWLSLVRIASESDVPPAPRVDKETQACMDHMLAFFAFVDPENDGGGGGGGVPVSHQPCAASCAIATSVALSRVVV